MASDPHRSLARRWRFAAKPASWPKLLVPCALGQAIGAASAPSWRALALGLAFTVFDLLFVVFLNDFGDRDVDAIKRRMFPQSSPKTIPDGVLPPHHLLIGGVLAGAMALAVAFTAQAWLDRPLFGTAGVLALFFLGAYTFPPLRLNYRGGGELLEAIGVGVVLPWMHAYLQSGRLFASAGLWLLPGFALMALASAIASGLSDERSDRRGGKRTFVTAFGNRRARRAVELLTFGGAFAWALTGLLTDALPAWVAVPPALVALFHAGAMTAQSEAAFTDAFDAQRRYKDALHKAIWRGAAVAAFALVAWQL